MMLIIASLILMVFGNNIMNFTMKYIPQLTNVVVYSEEYLTVNIFSFQYIHTLLYYSILTCIKKRKKVL